MSLAATRLDGVLSLAAIVLQARVHMRDKQTSEC